jgi:putative tryptophan/tyrosine transport system substrate-binding protein
MKQNPLTNFPSFQINNPRSAIQNPKWAGLLALALAFSLCEPVAGAQQTGKIFRIGFLDSSTASGMAVLVDAFRQELGKLGWSEEKNLTIEYRFAEQKNDRLPELAGELVRLKVDVIVVTGTIAALAAKSASTTIPIVTTSAADPVGAGLVVSLARPGRNVTGFTALSVELNTKRLEILKDAIPKLTRVGLLRSGDPQSSQLKELRSTALALKLKLEEIETQLDAKGLEAAFQTAKQKQVQAIMTLANRPFFAERRRSLSFPIKTVYPLFTSRRSLSMRVGSCRMGQITSSYIGARLFTLIRS